MNITYRTDKNILYIALQGRMNGSNAAEAEARIFAIKKEHEDKHLVIDAEGLEHISSAGLRVILKLRKERPALALINVSPDVYDIFHMTGFTSMLTIEKAYRQMNVDGCEFIAKGACGAVYRYDDETVVKVYFAKDALPEIKQERENARRAFVLGVNTAIPYDIVRVGDHYGTVTELLNAVSVTRMIRNNPEELTLPVQYYVDMLRSIHAIEVKDGEVPDMRETALGWADFVAPHLPEGQGEKLRALIEAIPKKNILLHGDYHTDNILVQNGEPLLIDLDTLCMGHPVFELGSMFNAFIGFSEAKPQNQMEFFGISVEVSKKIWDLTLRMYLNTEDEELCRSVAEKAMIIGYTRLLRRSLRRPQDPESPHRIANCKKRLGELLGRVDSLVF